MSSVLQLPWQVPFGIFTLCIDPLNIIFLIAIAVLVICAGVYGIGYMRFYQGKKSLVSHVSFYCIFVLTLLVIVSANNVILFLSAWEVMTISTFFLIIFNDEQESVRKAGFIYLVASHCATFCLFLMFFLMAHTAGSMNFDLIAKTSFPPMIAVTVFLLSLAGFGVKAGFLPLHIWLPHAHPAAPSHISALLSGIAIKMGIYGICRILWILGVLPDWCAYLLLGIGVVSGVMGVLYALGQHELKKLLAYHSVENIGIIALGLGVGLLGRNYHNSLITVLGFGGALLHVVNHAIFKGLLFLGAGSVIQQTHTGQIDRLGGLAKTMPLTSSLFMVGSLSICGLPLFNGFISEFLIYFGLFQGLFMLPLQGAVFCSLGIIALALMGALALACFTKVYGIVFSGEPRFDLKGEDPGMLMIIPMLVLAGLCIWIGLVPQTMVILTFLAGTYMSRISYFAVDLNIVMVPLSMVIGMSFLFLSLILGLVLLRRFMVGRKDMPVREAWRCGFTRCSPKMQYTSSSFACTIVEFVKNLLLVRSHGEEIKGAFPNKISLGTSVHDASDENIFRPLVKAMFVWSKNIDAGRVRYTQMYLMYIFLFLIFLLAWKLT
ncbi:MAG: hydrogenase [Candidatus Omnitrophica bacterium]|nr:hydrogenase [Candidatus Omnitrophota bacterium]